VDDVERIDDSRLRVTVDDGPQSDHGRYELLIESVGDESCYPILDQGAIDALWPGMHPAEATANLLLVHLEETLATAPGDAEVVRMTSRGFEVVEWRSGEEA
jgi:hypothetical protein